jgi:hypothetical protein
MIVKRVINPSKRNNIEGDIFHLLFLGTDAVLYDSLWDEPIIYGNKNLVRIAITNPKKLPSLLPNKTKEITLFVYRVSQNGELKRMGDPIKGKSTDITVPNY